MGSVKRLTPIKPAVRHPESVTQPPWKDPKVAREVSRLGRLMQIDAALQLLVLLPTALLVLGCCGIGVWFAIVR